MNEATIAKKQEMVEVVSEKMANAGSTVFVDYLGLTVAEVTDLRIKLRAENCEMKVTKNTLIGDILDYDVETARFFFEIGMHCLGCPASRGESIEQACNVHGTNCDELVEKLNAYFAEK